MKKVFRLEVAGGRWLSSQKDFVEDIQEIVSSFAHLHLTGPTQVTVKPVNENKNVRPSSRLEKATSSAKK